MSIIFTSKVNQLGIFFTNKVYELVSFENKYMNGYNFRYCKYMNGSFFLTSPEYMNGLGSGDSSSKSVPKTMEGYPRRFPQ